MTATIVAQPAPATVNPIGFPYYAGTDGSLSERILQAASRFTAKFGQKPKVCFIAADDDTGENTTTPGILVEISAGLKSGFMWLSAEAAA